MQNQSDSLNNLTVDRYYFEAHNYDITDLPKAFQSALSIHHFEGTVFLPKEIDEVLSQLDISQSNSETDSQLDQCLTTEIFTLIDLQLQIDINGGPENNGELFEKYLLLMENILKTFGLSNAQEYERMLFVDSKPSESIVKSISQKLHLSAQNHLASSPRTKLQILEDAMEMHRDPFDVFVELEIRTHHYPIFIYDEILVKNLDDYHSILSALQQTKEPGILNGIGILGFSKELEKKEKLIYTYLRQKRSNIWTYIYPFAGKTVLIDLNIE